MEELSQTPQSVASLPVNASTNLSNQVNAPNKAQWNLQQQDMTQGANLAGIPSVENINDSPSRTRLADAIKRSHQAGFKFPYFLGKPNEPQGDRAPTMDIENLVEALKLQEKSLSNSGKKEELNKVSKERAYWENEAKTGMSSQEWKNQTGEEDPKYQQ